MAKLAAVCQKAKALIRSERTKPPAEYAKEYAQIRIEFNAAENEATGAGVSTGDQAKIHTETGLSQQEIDELRSGASAGT